MDEKEKFIAELYPAAVKISEETGMSWQLILAQAAHETGWGKKVLPGTNNIFNIKAGTGWEGETKTFNVWERVNGKTIWVDQPFRVYETLDDAMADRVRFLRDNPRYAKAGLFDAGTIGDLAKEAAALQKAGYATDESYAKLLVDVFEGRTMRRALALAAPGMDQENIRDARRGDDVEQLQRSLNRLGYVGAAGHELAVDGNYGRRTRLAVEDFQRNHDLVADGIAGPLTMAAVQRAVETELRSIGQPDAPYLRPEQPNESLSAYRSLAPEPVAAPVMPVMRQEATGRSDDVSYHGAGVHQHEVERRFASVPDHIAVRQIAACSETIAHETCDPRYPQSSNHELYSELKRRIPDASEDRLVQFTAACHESNITAKNLVAARLDEDRGTLTFIGSGPLTRPAQIDLKSAPPRPEEAMEQIQQNDLQQAQLMEQVRAQQAQIGMSHAR